MCVCVAERRACSHRVYLTRRLVTNPPSSHTSTRAWNLPRRTTESGPRGDNTDCAPHTNSTLRTSFSFCWRTFIFFKSKQIFFYIYAIPVFVKARSQTTFWTYSVGLFFFELKQHKQNRKAELIVMERITSAQPPPFVPKHAPLELADMQG